ncbi:type III secretion system translocon subunit SctB [Shewanella sp. VB17]|uniref:type III secretion system translocon subunit SctB n=1 Tax=Shewanella sp. VB17 TaxID=2739432 RepID=UPI001567097C|nr:type III secretion system translocon subunit SctB [Shewanella sp. VB17]NRD71744.1 type III secretion system translocon subunit SctB [Shewanella sp. VB17]
MNIITQSEFRGVSSNDITSVESTKAPKTTPFQVAENGEMLSIRQGNRVVLEAPLANLDPTQTVKLSQLLESINSEELTNRLGTAVNVVEKKLNEFLSSVGIGGKSSASPSGKSDSSDIFALMVLLFQLAKDNRELNITQRDIAASASVASIKAQAAELRTAKGALIAMAVVSGVLAMSSAVMGGLSAKKSINQLNESGNVNNKLANQQKFKDTLTDLQDEGKSVSRALRGTDAEIGQLSRKNSELDTLLRARDSRGQARNAVLQGVGQVTNNAGSVVQTEAQASQKEEEAEGTLQQAEKQKADDRVSYNDNFLKEVREMYRTIADSQNQAWKAATTLS